MRLAAAGDISVRAKRLGRDCGWQFCPQQARIALKSQVDDGDLHPGTRHALRLPGIGVGQADALARHQRNGLQRRTDEFRGAALRKRTERRERQTYLHEVPVRSFYGAAERYRHRAEVIPLPRRRLGDDANARIIYLEAELVRDRERFGFSPSLERSQELRQPRVEAGRAVRLAGLRGGELSRRSREHERDRTSNQHASAAAEGSSNQRHSDGGSGNGLRLST